MENASWDSTADLESSCSASKLRNDDITFLTQHAHEYNFYQLTELLKCVDNVTISNKINQIDGGLLFLANPSLGFAASDINALTRDEASSWQLTTNFLGLSGAQSPLPDFMIEHLPSESKDGNVNPFLNFFSHRLLNLAYQIWHKYRYYLRFEPNATDVVSNQLFALVGLGNSSLRNQESVNPSKMLSYAGTLVSRGRSALIVSGIIAHCFDLDEVTIQQWQKRRVPINDEQKNLLGKQNITLATNLVIGSHATDIKGKFRICIADLALSRFEDFLPMGKDFSALRMLVEFILRDQLSYDLELMLAEKENPTTQLDKNLGTKLGWTSFLGKGKQKKSMVIQVRQ